MALSWLASAHTAENIGVDRLVPPNTSTNCGAPGTLVGVTTISHPVSGSAFIAISGVCRNLPGSPFWNLGCAYTMLAPPPPPSMNPKNSGGMVGGLGAGLAMRTSFKPQPVCSLMLSFGSRNVLVPPTAVANGEVELAPADTESMPKSAWLASRLSPESPVEMLCEIPSAAAISEMPFSTTSSEGASSASTISGMPKLFDSWLPKPFSMANRLPISRLVNVLSAVTTSTMLAPGASECAHSTSRVVSNCQLPAMQPLVAEQVVSDAPFGVKIWKFAEVSGGRPLFAENALASARIVFEPNASTIMMV